MIRLWELEDISDSKPFSMEQLECENNFRQTNCSPEYFSRKALYNLWSKSS